MTKEITNILKLLYKDAQLNRLVVDEVLCPSAGCGFEKLTVISY